MGFIFYKKSKRFVGENFDFSLLQQIPKSIKKVAVFVNEAIEKVINLSIHFDLVQLHGNESIDYCHTLKNKNIKVIKALSIDNELNTNEIKKYSEAIDYFLFDTKSENYGAF